MIDPLSVPTFHKEIRMQIGDLSSCCDQELISAMDALYEWWTIRRPIADHEGGPIIPKAVDPEA